MEIGERDAFNRIVVTGAGTLEKRGGGTLVLSGDNGQFQGALTLSAGTLEIAAAGHVVQHRHISHALGAATQLVECHRHSARRKQTKKVRWT